MSKRTLVAYATKGGVAEEYARAIAEVLKKQGMEVDLVNLRKEKEPDVSGYDNFVVGGGVRMQKVYKETLWFLGKNLEGKKVAVFLASSEAGDPKSYHDAVNKYMKPIKEKYPNLNIVAIDGFGGRIKIFGKVLVDSRDLDKVKKWAESVGKKFKSK